MAIEFGSSGGSTEAGIGEEGTKGGMLAERLWTEGKASFSIEHL